MIKEKALIVFVVIGLVLATRCARDMQPEPHPGPTEEMVELTLTAEPTERLDKTATPDVHPPSEAPQPPVDQDPIRVHPADRARADLAQRLHVESGQVEVVDTISRAVDAEVKACFNHTPASSQLWANVAEVQWIVLSVGKKQYHYIHFEDLIVYCEK